MKRCGKSVVLLTVVIGLLAMAVYEGTVLQSFSNKLHYVNQSGEGFMTPSQALELQRKGTEAAPVVMWGKAGRQTVTSPALGASADAEILAVCGRTDLLIPSAAWLDYDQQNSCLLGFDTASRIFGSRNAEGLQVEWNNTVYKVAGVLTHVEDGFIYEAASQDTILFNRVTMDCGENSRRQIVKNQFTSMYPDGVELNYELVIFFAGLLLLPVPIMAADELAKRLGKARWIGNGVVIILVTLLLSFPSSFIPAKWSDFSFWITLWQEEKAGLLLFITEEMAGPDLIFLQHFVRGALYSLMSWISMCFLKRQEVLKYGYGYLRQGWESLWKRGAGSKRVQSGH